MQEDPSNPNTNLRVATKVCFRYYRFSLNPKFLEIPNPARIKVNLLKQTDQHTRHPRDEANARGPSKSKPETYAWRPKLLIFDAPTFS
jgi:hypothetical protein